jgi:hypothetical protein
LQPAERGRDEERKGGEKKLRKIKKISFGK